MPSSAAHTNRLIESTSPYLLQHAHNPVDWWPWCDEALALARREDRPILLSIGYSACHWCHVMAHESFEHAQTAELMNRLFVNIKVDREERPDLDRIYQTAHQMLAQRPGGWPLTVFLMPEDQTPFFAGTYFPRTPRSGLPAFVDVLDGVHRAYREQHETILEQNEELMKAMQQLEPGSAGEMPDSAPLERARRELASSFDAERGGFGSAPKFPHPSQLELLLRHYASTRDAGRADDQALVMVRLTLTKMVRGGVNDQLGGGFCRYSTDDDWMIPHFEKMLYDNGPLLWLLCDLWVIDGDALFRRAAQATADWVMREMQGADGGYASSMDADSEGEEGRFYAWDREQVRGLLDGKQYEVFAAVYGLDRPANFEGRWHLHGWRTAEEIAERLALPLDEVEALLRDARSRLLAARALRVAPGQDDKVLTSWNALMIKGMARAARVLGEPAYLASAERALAMIRTTLWRDGRLLATARGGEGRLNAYLDDYALLLDALLELLQVRFNRAELDWALALAERLLAGFADAEQGGFFFTSDDHEALIVRSKPLSDEAMPSGNGVAARALQRLGHLLGEVRYLDAASATLGVAAESLGRVPYAHASLLSALDEHLNPVEIIVIRAPEGEQEPWLDVARRGFHPRRMVLAIGPDEVDLPGALRGMKAEDGAPVAYRCQATACSAPARSVDELASTLT